MDDQNARRCRPPNPVRRVCHLPGRRWARARRRRLAHDQQLWRRYGRSHLFRRAFRDRCHRGWCHCPSPLRGDCREGSVSGKAARASLSLPPPTSNASETDLSARRHFAVAGQADMVYSRLARRLRATNKNSFGDYLEMLEKGNSDEWERFVNSLTTNLTSFFREPHHFPIFAEHLKKLGSRNPIRVWCSAASTGEEPYSIAMTVAETFNSFTTPVSIIATDLDTNVLATADKGSMRWIGSSACRRSD